MPIPNQFLRRRSTIAFFTQEDVAFDYKYPADTSALVTVDPIDLNQTLNFTDLNEVGTRLLNMQSVLNYGERTDASFQVISKIGATPTLTLGNVVGEKAVPFRPAEHFLINQLMGSYTEYLDESGVGGTDNRLNLGGTLKDCVGYSFKDTPNTFQISQLVNGHMLKCAMGSILSGGSLNVSREGALTWEVNSRSAMIKYSGTAAADAATTSTSQALANPAGPQAGETIATLELSMPTGSKAEDVLKIGDHFAIVDGGTSSNQGNVLESAELAVAAGYAASNNLVVNAVSGNTISLVNGYTCVNGFTNDAYVVPILPEPNLSAQPAQVIPQGNAQIFMASRDASLQTLFDPSNGFLASDFTMNIDKSLGDPGVGELNGQMYPAPTYVAQDYSVSGTMSMVLRPKDLYRFNNFLRDYDKSIGIKIEVPSVDLNGTDYRTVYIALRSVRISFEGSEQEGAEGASLNWILTKGGSTITTDQELLSIIYA
jgi:hypothetical protein